MASESFIDFMETIMSKAQAQYSHKELFKMIRQEVPDFKVGDLVTWKCEQLCPSKLPLPGEAFAVCAERMKEPVFDRDGGAGTAYYAMPLDLLVSTVDLQGDYVEIMVDARRIKYAD